MFFTRTDKTFRAWFHAVRSTGELRTGLVAGDFVVRVVNPADSAISSPAVTESTSLSGLYYFDIPSSFLGTHGIGDYGVSIRIDSIAGPSGAPNVRSAEAEVLHVTQEDFDSLSGSIWNTTASQFNVTGSMGYLQNLIAGISGNVLPNSIASAVWNAIDTSFSTSGTMGFLVNLIDTIASQSAQTVTVPSIVSGVWNASTTTFNSPGTMGFLQNLNTVINSNVAFMLSASYVASGTVVAGTTATSISSSISASNDYFNGMLLLVENTTGSGGGYNTGSLVRVIDQYVTSTFGVDPGFSFTPAIGANVYVVAHQFVPGYGRIG